MMETRGHNSAYGSGALEKRLICKVFRPLFCFVSVVLSLFQHG